jgi:hypothetical protein
MSHEEVPVDEASADRLQDGLSAEAVYDSVFAITGMDTDGPGSTRSY